MANANQKARNNRKASTEKLSVDTLTSVLSTVEKERVEAHRALRDHNKKVVKRMQATQEKVAPLRERVSDAQGKVKAEERYKPHLPEDQYKARLAPLEKELEKAQKALRRAQQDAQGEVEELNQAGQRLQGKCDTLSSEWRHHARLAEAAGADLADYWTPEKPLPDDEGQEDA